MTEILSLDPMLTDEAASKAKQLMDREGRDDLFLRLSVQPGGCAGLRYQLFFDERELEDDHYYEQSNGLIFAVDRMSLPYLMGARIIWQDGLMGSGFQIENPNAQGSCACGDSFS